MMLRRGSSRELVYIIVVGHLYCTWALDMLMAPVFKYVRCGGWDLHLIMVSMQMELWLVSGGQVLVQHSYGWTHKTPSPLQSYATP